MRPSCAACSAGARYAIGRRAPAKPATARPTAAPSSRRWRRHRADDDAQLLDPLVVEGGLPGRPVEGLDVEGDEDGPFAGWVEPLDDGPSEPGRRPGVDPADRVTRLIVAHAGIGQGLLEEALTGPFLAAPAGSRLDTRNGNRPRSDEESVDTGPVLGRREAGEQVAGGQVDRTELDHAAAARLDVEVADDPLERGEGPGVDEHSAEVLAGRQRPLADLDRRARLVVCAEPGHRQAASGSRC